QTGSAWGLRLDDVGQTSEAAGGAAIRRNERAICIEASITPTVARAPSESRRSAERLDPLLGIEELVARGAPVLLDRALRRGRLGVELVEEAEVVVHLGPRGIERDRLLIQPLGGMPVALGPRGDPACEEHVVRLCLERREPRARSLEPGDAHAEDP